jgi:hypothetical protein
MIEIGIWEKEYLNERIKELKHYLEEKKKAKDEDAFLAEKILELYEFMFYLGSG